MHCARCGASLEDDSARTISPNLPLRLCEACGDDYNVYLSAKAGKSEDRDTWQNDDWFMTWASWLKYQESLCRLAGSKEFQELLTDEESPFE